MVADESDQRKTQGKVSMYKIAIVGLGPAGILALAHLPPEVQRQTVVFEPNALGGTLATDYASVVANIPKSVIVTALKEVPGWSGQAFPHFDKYTDDQCPILNDVVRQIRELVVPDLGRVSFHSSRITEYTQLSATAPWRLKTSTGATYETQKLVLCTGAAPKILDLPKSAISLSAALTPAILQNYVAPTDRVVVFGTAHSGTLALKNLRAAGVTRLTALHKGDTAFFFARDGHTEGVKQESAAIADSIIADKWATLISMNDFAAAHRAVAEATAVVYAIGFERPVLPSGSNVYGFGIGFPALYTAPDGHQYPDVGFGGFIAAIKASLPSLLTFEP